MSNSIMCQCKHPRTDHYQKQFKCKGCECVAFRQYKPVTDTDNNTTQPASNPRACSEHQDQPYGQRGCLNCVDAYKKSTTPPADRPGERLSKQEYVTICKVMDGIAEWNETNGHKGCSKVQAYITLEALMLERDRRRDEAHLAAILAEVDELTAGKAPQAVIIAAVKAIVRAEFEAGE